MLGRRLSIVGSDLSTAEVKAAVERLLSGWSIETAPAIAAKIPSLAELLPSGTSVYITCLPGSDFRDVVTTAARIRSEGLVPVPHIPARSVPSVAFLDEHLAALKAEAAVDHVLVIGGGVSTPVGPFDRTMQLLETGLLQKHGVRTVGVAGHPEGSKDISPAELARAVAEKNAFAVSSGLDFHIATQFCFDAQAIIAWDRSLRAAGNRLPIHIGIAGPAKLKSLISFAASCGVGPSMRFLTRQAMNIARLATVSVPDQLLTALARYQASEPDCGIAKTHYFAFGGLPRTAGWLGAMTRGEFDVTADGRGFTLRQPLD